MEDNTPNLKGSYRDSQFANWPSWRIDEELFGIPVPGPTEYLLTRGEVAYQGTTFGAIRLTVVERILYV